MEDLNCEWLINLPLPLQSPLRPWPLVRSRHLAWLFHCRPCLNWAPASGKSATQSCSEDSSSGIESWSSIVREQRSTCTVETRQDRRWLSGLSADNGVRQRQHMTRSWASKELRGSALRDYLNASVKCTAFKMALLHSISREVWRWVPYTTCNNFDSFIVSNQVS
jgi:hypothetical protein